MLTSKLNHVLRAGLLVIAAGFTVATIEGCQDATGDQCNTGPAGDSDCERILGLSTGQALCDKGTCRTKGTPEQSNNPDAGGPPVEAGPPPCTSTQHCTELAGGKASICREPNKGSCVTIENDLCTVAPSGDYWKQAANPIFVGVLFNKTQLGDANAVQFYEAVNEKAAQLAEQQWNNQTVGGIAVGSERRPIVGVYCDIKFDPETTRRAFDHVTLDLGAQAVITETPRDVYPYLDDAEKRGTFVYLTEFGSDEIAASGKLHGRVFTSYSDPAYSIPLVKNHISSHLEADIRAQRGLAPTDKIKVVALGSRQASLSESNYLDNLKASLVFNGAPASMQDGSAGGGVYYKEVNPTVAPGGVETDFLATAQAISAFAPDIIITTEARDFHFWYMPLIESTWPLAATYRPQYFPLEGAAFASRFAVSVGANDELRHRVRGVWQAVYAASGPVFTEFLNAYNAEFKDPEPNEFITSGFDAFHSTAYGIAAALTTATVDGNNLKGADIGAGMKRLVGGTPVELQPATLPNMKIAQAVAILQQQGSLDLIGTTGTLDWAPVTGAAQSDASLYCVARQSDGSLSIGENEEFYRYGSAGFDDSQYNPNACR